MKLPNILTLLRVAMIPVFIWSFFSEGISNWFTFAVFILAAITDALDGAIARKQNIVTDFGKLMDPLADKLMVMTAFICFTAAGMLNPVITIIIMAREFLVTGLRGIASSKGKVIAADIWGKIKTIFQDIAVGAILVKSASGAEDLSFIGIITGFSVAAMTVLTVISALNYCLKNKEYFKG